MDRLKCAGTAAAAFLIVMGAACGNQGGSVPRSAETVDEAYQEADQKRKMLASADERLAVVEDFLSRFPDSSHTPEMAWLAAFYQLELGNAAAGFAYVDDLRSKVTDPETVYQMDRRLMTLYGRGGETDRMLQIAENVDQREGLDFNAYDGLMSVLEEAGDWQAALDLCERARPLATEEAFRSDYPDQEFTDERVVAAARNRRAMLANHQGWAATNLGRVDEALRLFAAAGDGVRSSYLGVPMFDLNLHWGEALVRSGDFEQALQRLAPDALILGRPEALAALERAYVGLHGDSSGLEEYSRRTRLAIARTIDDFELPDYAGERHSLASLRGEATLLAFWFPT